MSLSTVMFGSCILGLAGEDDPLDAQVERILDENPDLIVTLSTSASLAAATAIGDAQIPLLFGAVTDPIGSGLVDSLVEPGKNRTGVGTFANPRALQILVEAAGTETVFTLRQPEDPASITALAQTQEAAEALGVELAVVEVGTLEEVSEAMQTMPDDIDAVFQMGSIFSNQNLELVVEAAQRRGVPVGTNAGAPSKTAGVLTSVGIVNSDLGHQMARQAAAILEGVSASVIPVEGSEIHYAVNLETARILGLEVPDSVLFGAQEVYGR